jgi:hypothetical protein
MPVGRPFKKSERPVGRAPGTPNKMTADVRWAIAEAADHPAATLPLEKNLQNPQRFELPSYTTISGNYRPKPTSVTRRAPADRFLASAGARR